MNLFLTFNNNNMKNINLNLLIAIICFGALALTMILCISTSFNDDKIIAMFCLAISGTINVFAYRHKIKRK